MSIPFAWLEDLRYARSARDLERCVRYFATEHALPYYGFTAELICGHVEGERVSFHNFSGPWAKRYALLGHCGMDPRIQAAEHAMPAVAWSSDGDLQGLLDPAPANTAQLIADAGEHGLHAGVAVPWCGRGVHWAFLSFSRDTRCDPRTLLAQTTLAQYFCGHLINAMLRSRDRRGDLAGHALDALAWYAAGEPAHAIAKRLNISIHTVRTYLRRACVRLGARNLSHAVAIAVRRGMVG